MPGTDYADRLLNGLPVGDEDWEAHLLRAHEETPGMTPPAFGAYRTREGLSSYEILASALARDAPSCRILDLACGDGFLVQYLLPRIDARSRVWGVDMVPTEIERARRAYPDPRTEFLCERAQRLSLPSASIDLVLSHLALMLMSPIEPVIAELRRVMKPAGRLAAVIGGPRVAGSLAEEITLLTARFLKRHFPRMQSPRVGDARFSSADGIRDLFAPARGFADDLAFEDFLIEVRGDLGAFWAFWKDTYLAAIVPAELKPRFRAELDELLRPRLGPDATVLVEFPVRRFEVSADGSRR